jgi:23S rRNA (cytosine1962-C5)-methyltransferase
MSSDYELLDSGQGRKLERFGPVMLSRPLEQADWDMQRPELWRGSLAEFDRAAGWSSFGGADLPAEWVVTINGIDMKLKPTPAGHLGVFPETRALWDSITKALRPTPDASVLNLFAYSGGATLAAARAGCSMCQLDYSKSMVTRARENAALNDLADAPIRWIVEDVTKFPDREIRRGRHYDAIMLDPPSFGRGTGGEQYKIDKDLVATREKCKALLSEEPAFVLLTSHTLGMTAREVEGVLADVMGEDAMTRGEMELTGAADVRPVPSGVWARCWSR